MAALPSVAARIEYLYPRGCFAWTGTGPVPTPPRVDSSSPSASNLHFFNNPFFRRCRVVKTPDPVDLHNESLTVPPVPFPNQQISSLLSCVYSPETGFGSSTLTVTTSTPWYCWWRTEDAR